MTRMLSQDTIPLGDLTVTRMGYGAMQLAGPKVYGPPRDPGEAAAVLKEAVAAGINHLDTSDFYGPHTVNQLIRSTLHPYAKELVIVTKVGARREADTSWHAALSPRELVAAVDDNLRNLGVDRLDVVNLRVFHGLEKASITEPFAVLVEQQRAGKIRHLGLSNVTAAQLAEARTLAPVVCVQNQYNLAHREDDALVDTCARQGIAYVPFFPLGGFSPLQSSELDACAAAVGATPLQVALAWLLQRSPTMLLIPGTSSRTHLRENIAAHALALPPAIVARLDAIAKR
jgi:pyridoxine 4-dehydrogenase